MKYKSRLFIFLFILPALFFGFPAEAEPSAGGFTVSAAVGLLYTPGSIRVGYNNWEFGYLNVSTFGFNYLVRQDSTYTTFGLGAVGNGIGFYGGVGWEPSIRWGLHFRTEAGAAGNFSGSAVGGLLMGLSYWF